MKKLLGILSSLGLSAVAGFSVVACSNIKRTDREVGDFEIKVANQECKVGDELTVEIPNINYLIGDDYNLDKDSLRLKLEKEGFLEITTDIKLIFDEQKNLYTAKGTIKVLKEGIVKIWVTADKETKKVKEVKSDILVITIRTN